MPDVALELSEFIRDPFGTLAAARKSGWLVQMFAGVMTVRHEAVRELLGDARLEANFTDFLNTFGVTSGPFYDWMAISPLNHDGKDHQRWRGLMARTFTPRRMAQALLEAMVEQAVGSEHVLEAAQQAVQGDHADVCHRPASPGFPAPSPVVFTVCLQSRYEVARAMSNRGQVTYQGRPGARLCGFAPPPCSSPSVFRLERLRWAVS